PSADSRRGSAGCCAVADPIHAGVSADAARGVRDQYRGSGVYPTGQNSTRIRPEATFWATPTLLTDDHWCRYRLGPHPQLAPQSAIRRRFLGLSAGGLINVR